MVMKLKTIALTIACTSMLIALPVSTSAACRQDNDVWQQVGQELHNPNTNLNDYKFNSNDGNVYGNLTIININDTTGPAVSISFNNTTASAVTIPIDVTTDSAISLPLDTTTAPEVDFTLDNIPNFDYIANQYNEEENKIDDMMQDINNKVNKQFDEMQKQEERILKFMYR